MRWGLPAPPRPAPHGGSTRATSGDPPLASGGRNPEGPYVWHSPFPGWALARCPARPRLDTCQAGPEWRPAPRTTGLVAGGRSPPEWAVHTLAPERHAPLNGSRRGHGFRGRPDAVDAGGGVRGRAPPAAGLGHGLAVPGDGAGGHPRADGLGLGADRRLVALHRGAAGRGHPGGPAGGLAPLRRPGVGLAGAGVRGGGGRLVRPEGA